MIITFDEYQILYKVLLDTFLKRNEIDVTKIGRSKYSPTVWTYKANATDEIFGGSGVLSPTYFYRLYDKYKPEKVGKAAINDFALKQALTYLEIPEGSATGQRANDVHKLRKRLNIFLEKYTSSNSLESTNSEDQNLKDESPIFKDYLVSDNKRYILSVFEVIELFCQLIERYEEGNSSDKKSVGTFINTPRPDQLEEILVRCDKEYSALFSQEIDPINNPYLLYEIKLSIKKGTPHIFSESELLSLLKFLKINASQYKPIRSIAITERFLHFQGTCWSFFYFIFYKNGNTIKRCLGQAIIEFGSYGRVKFKSISQNYVGYYQTYGENEYYIQMSLKLEGSNQRDMRILVYCGSAVKPEIMLGQYNNIEVTITAGNIVMENIAGKYDDLLPRHIYQDNPDYSNINPFIREYLEDQNLSSIESPAQITSYDRLEEFLKRRSLH